MSEKVKFTVDGKEYEVPPNELEKYEVERKTGYERADEKEKYYVNMVGIVKDYPEEGCEFDNLVYKERNYYNSGRLAKDCARADTLLRQIRRWQAENDDEVDFGWDSTTKWQIVYDLEDDDIFISPVCLTKFLGGIYFTSRSKAVEAADEFKDELKWYFTEYRTRL